MTAVSGGHTMPYDIPASGFQGEPGTRGTLNDKQVSAGLSPPGGALGSLCARVRTRIRRRLKKFEVTQERILADSINRADH